MGMAVDESDNYFVHSLDGFLHEIDSTTGALTKICKTGLLNVLDIAYKVDSGTIWAVNGNGMHIIDHKNGCAVDEFPQVGLLFRHVCKAPSSYKKFYKV